MRASHFPTVALGSQDVSTGTGRIVVEPGSEPIYLVVATFRPVIWRVSGAVERLERVVLAATSTGPNRGLPDEVPLAGITGVSRERVDFAKDNSCLRYFYEVPSAAAAAAAASVRAATGKEPSVAARYAVDEFLVPSGQIRNVGSASSKTRLVIEVPGGNTLLVDRAGNVAVEARTKRLQNEMLRFNPGGVVEIDPDSVVAIAPVMPYEVLPQEAGLMQLVDSGALTRIQSGEYIIREKIQFPAGLFGASSVKFLLLAGVPRPEGNPGN